jgi:hypothetical protein
MNGKKSSKTVTSVASEILRDPSSSKIQKQLAGSVLSQSNSKKQTGADMESKASNVLKSEKYNATSKSLAGSVLSQSDKKR